MKSFARRSRTWLLCAAAAFVPTAALRAASPRDELLRFVPDNVGFCFVMQDLRVHAAELADSPFVAQLRHSPLGAALQASKELGQLDQIDRGLKRSVRAASTSSRRPPRRRRGVRLPARPSRQTGSGTGVDPGAGGHGAGPRPPWWRRSTGHRRRTAR